MKSNFFYLLALLALANASPNPQFGVNSKIPTAPLSKVPPTPLPFANAALWNEAVANDARLGAASTTTQYFYATIAWVQTQENSSNSILTDSLSGARAASQGLQALSLYPTEFNQAQALDPANTIGTSFSLREFRIK